MVQNPIMCRPDWVPQLLQSLLVQNLSSLLSAVTINDRLSAAQTAQLQALIRAKQAAFCTSAHEVGVVANSFGIEHILDTKEVDPVTQKPYKYSRAEQDYLVEQIKMLIEAGLIRPSKSPWMSPVVLIKKKDGTLRLCIDFRRLNDVTVKDAYPLPNVDQIISSMSGCKFFTSLDVQSAFWNVRVAERDVYKTAFAVPGIGHFEWLRMPFGLINASSTFQRLIDKVLENIKFAKAYIDDVIVFSRSWEEHLEHLNVVLDRLLASGLKLKLKKCIFAASKIAVLGSIVSEAGVHPDPEKLVAIKDLPAPHDVSGIRRFMGMVNYYSQFIPDFARMSAPLHKLTRKGEAFVWDEHCRHSFEQLKAALCSDPVLRLPDWEKDFHIHTDWSKEAIGAVLSQQDESSGMLMPVAYAGRVLSDCESRYPPVEGECLAIVWAMHQKFRHYIHMRKVHLHTDQAPLAWLKKARMTNSKCERWSLKLQEFDYTVAHIPGKDNVVADCLSRNVSACALKARQGHQMNQELKAVEDIACCICSETAGHDNMAFCDICDRPYHLRCITPPLLTAPTGAWYCPGCDPLYNNLKEMYDERPVLKYAKTDPHRHRWMLSSDSSDLTPAQRRVASNMAVNVQWHPTISSFLKVRRIDKYGTATWLTNPTRHYRWDLIVRFHDILGHAGINQTVSAMRQYYTWPGISADVAAVVQCCDACQRRALLSPPVQDLHPPEVYGPLQHVHVDLCGPFPLGDTKKYIMVMLDYFTKVAEICSIPNKEPVTTARAFYDAWICRYTIPAAITTDNGGEWSAAFQHMVQRLGMQHLHTSAMHPSANGAAERMVQSVKRMLAKLVNNHVQHWERMLPAARQAYVNKVHSATGFSPNHLLFGFQPKIPVAALSAQAQPVAGQPFCQYVQELEEMLGDLDEQALASMQRQFRDECSNRTAKLARQSPRPLQIGDLVLEIHEGAGPLQHQARGPYKVVALRPPASVLLQTGAVIGKSALTFSRHASRLILYHHKHGLLTS